MGVNLTPRVGGFRIDRAVFASDSEDVEDGCVTSGQHRLLRFDFATYNAGDADLNMGNPRDRPDIFVWSAAHQHYHVRGFNEFILFDAAGNQATVGYKQSFCLVDVERVSDTARRTDQFGDCNEVQGLSAGWADVYGGHLACQFIVLDDLPDGDYTLKGTTNAERIAGEDCYGDNTIWAGLRFTRDEARRALDGRGLFLGAPLDSGTETLEVINPPFIPEDRIRFNRENVAATRVGFRWKVVEGGWHWMLDSGYLAAGSQRAVEVINHYRLSYMCFVGRPTCGAVRPMMYWLTDEGEAPSGELEGEECFAFDRRMLTAAQREGRWGVLGGMGWLHDFGPAGQGNAIAAVHFLQKYGFNQKCSVTVRPRVWRPLHRPTPVTVMTYFKRSR